jgi:hypothetical protein
MPGTKPKQTCIHVIQRFLILFSILVCSGSLVAAQVSFAKAEAGQFKVSPADPEAGVSTVRLLENMRKLAEEGIMIGHQDDLAYGIGWKAPNGKSDVFRVCRDYPAIFGWDLGGIELGSAYNLDSVPFADIKKYALEMHAKGGINTFSWHCNNPLTGSNAWDVSRNDVVRSILPGGEKHTLFVSWLDRVATFLASLKTESGEPIPVIFRPFHEQTGSWFWWGKSLCTAGEFSKMWQFTFTYLTEKKHLHNLLFAFSTGGDFANLQEFSDRYPGDKFVDIVGFDLYQNKGQPDSKFTKVLTERLKILLEFTKANHKLAAITELGYEQIPSAEWWTKTFYPAVKDKPVSYALFWRNAANRPNHYYMPYPGQVSEQDFKKLYDLPGTFFLKDLEKVHIYK